ncbi:uncharacterized protein TRIVIDRAFT_68940 [Trichoderma virens Gv29-8]|uniref:Uncharacterized protein n=1 Tax=Hypocrea virens (strain Gv29-8 / FGSC 10586) TaxID=413071 RepID=G9MYT4_HYPVG|nr:uncharacterized protein TRIVIDRAFT_68940 [Trichoderma virens Gv29-8]EHK20263.1 hypothetical protein TRIVIDRAFT_68940 [Trichoderma virens Gv29-8]UKZ46923.1 hypothetical protein TrVGV298_001134 [Trichoderma virens]
MPTYKGIVYEGAVLGRYGRSKYLYSLPAEVLSRGLAEGVLIRLSYRILLALIDLASKNMTAWRFVNLQRVYSYGTVPILIQGRVVEVLPNLHSTSKHIYLEACIAYPSLDPWLGNMVQIAGPSSSKMEREQGFVSSIDCKHMALHTMYLALRTLWERRRVVSID